MSFHSVLKFFRRCCILKNIIRHLSINLFIPYVIVMDVYVEKPLLIAVFLFQKTVSRHVDVSLTMCQQLFVLLLLFVKSLYLTVRHVLRDDIQ